MAVIGDGRRQMHALKWCNNGTVLNILDQAKQHKVHAIHGNQTIEFVVTGVDQTGSH